MSELYEQLNDLYQLHKAAKDLEHGIKKDSWTFFEPSKFVYAFFAFNSFYSIDWEMSVRRERVCSWEYRRDSNENLKEMDKIDKLISFIYNSILYSKTDDLNAGHDRWVSQKVSAKMASYIGIESEKIFEILENINLDSRIKSETKSRFIFSLNQILKNEVIDENIKDSLSNVLKFVFLVRNNIFHGSKTVIEMMNKNQSARLNIYTHIIIALNDLLFESIETRFKWNRKQVDEDFDGNIRKIEKRAFQSFKDPLSKYGEIDIPEGILFYPCCGNDTLKPLKLFIDRIGEYHFVDNLLVPQLPILECDVEGYQETSTLSSSVLSSRELISKHVVYSAVSYPPDNYVIPYSNISNLKIKDIKCAGLKSSVSSFLKDEWFLRNNMKKINLFRHLQDGLAVFSTLDNVSVFYLVGDSEGEGGSGQRWFQKNVFDIILDKLIDGGLIVTDGSSYDPNSFENVEWKNMLKTRRRKSNVQVTKDWIPMDFNYNNRDFRCLGKVGNRYGPIYAWQVHRLSEK